jgi:hypothetical protein
VLGNIDGELKKISDGEARRRGEADGVTSKFPVEREGPSFEATVQAMKSNKSSFDRVGVLGMEVPTGV